MRVTEDILYLEGIDEIPVLPVRWEDIIYIRINRSTITVCIMTKERGVHLYDERIIKNKRRTALQAIKLMAKKFQDTVCLLGDEFPSAVRQELLLKNTAIYSGSPLPEFTVEGDFVSFFSCSKEPVMLRHKEAMLLSPDYRPAIKMGEITLGPNAIGPVRENVVAFRIIPRYLSSARQVLCEYLPKDGSEWMQCELSTLRAACASCLPDGKTAGEKCDLYSPRTLVLNMNIIDLDMSFKLGRSPRNRIAVYTRDGSRTILTLPAKTAERLKSGQRLEDIKPDAVQINKGEINIVLTPNEGYADWQDLLKQWPELTPAEYGWNINLSSVDWKTTIGMADFNHEFVAPDMANTRNLKLKSGYGFPVSKKCHIRLRKQADSLGLVSPEINMAPNSRFAVMIGKGEINYVPVTETLMLDTEISTLLLPGNLKMPLHISRKRGTMIAAKLNQMGCKLMPVKVKQGGYDKDLCKSSHKAYLAADKIDWDRSSHLCPVYYIKGHEDWKNSCEKQVHRIYFVCQTDQTEYEDSAEILMPHDEFQRFQRAAGDILNGTE